MTSLAQSFWTRKHGDLVEIDPTNFESEISEFKEGTVFVTTNVNVPCEANLDCDPNCLSCGGLGYISIDIETLSKEFPS